MPVAIAQMAAPEFGVPPRSVFDISPRIRRTRPEALARETVIYLTHVGAGIPLRLLQGLMWSDRRDMRRAIQRVETARDDAGFDALLARLEARIEEEFGA